ncbi:MAG: VanW family protein [Thermoanaerobacteraceae bacterium]
MQTKDTNTKPKNNNYFYVLLLILILILFTTSITYFYFILNSNTIIKGVFINGISIGGYDKKEAISILEHNLFLPDDLKINLKYKDDTFTLFKNDIDLKYDYKKIIDDAYNIGRTGNPVERIKNIYEISKSGEYLIYYPEWNSKKVKDFIEKVSKDIEISPIDAKIHILNGTINITDDKDGIKVNKTETFNRVRDCIDTIIKNNENSGDVLIATEKVEAKVKKAVLAQIKSKIATFSTSFNQNDVNRSENLYIAAKALNGAILMPGDKFSLNKRLGPRIIENGYKEAPVIVGNKLVPDIGGGVCQVATTLYNAVLRADIKIDERYHHTFPVGYVSPGQDATISGDILDLKFENSSKYPIYIESFLNGNHFVVNIYGYTKDLSKKIEIYSEIVEKYEPKITYVDDPTLPEGEEIIEVQEHTGYKVNIYRLVYINNVLFKKEFLYTDVYKAVDGIIRKGTKKVDKQKTEREVNSKENDNNIPSVQPELQEDLNGEPQNILPTN